MHQPGLLGPGSHVSILHLGSACRELRQAVHAGDGNPQHWGMGIHDDASRLHARPANHPGESSWCLWPSTPCRSGPGSMQAEKVMGDKSHDESSLGLSTVPLQQLASGSMMIAGGDARVCMDPA